MPFNRTILELKLLIWFNEGKTPQTFNRTILELKQQHQQHK